MTSRELTHARDLLRELIARDIKLRYRGSILGILWTLVNPLAELLVLLFVFGTVFRIDIPNFPAYLFTGLIVYGWFQTSLSFATGAVVGNRELIHRPGVPALVLPMVTVAANMVHFLLSLPVLVLLLLITGVGLTPFVLTLPVLVLIEFVLILGCAYFVATFHVQFRDTQHVLRIALQLLFYLTPVFYESRHVPESLRWVYFLNPMAHLVDAFRAVVLRGELPPTPSLLFLLIVPTAILAAGFFWYRRASYRFADHI